MTAHEIIVPPALDAEHIRILAHRVAVALAGEPEDGPLILRGHGRVFCEGLNLGGCALADGPEHFIQPLTEFIDLILQIHFDPRTTIALVEGHAAGGGLGIAAACDVIWATPEASFSLPEVHVGLAPNVIVPLLRRRISDARVRAMALDGLCRDSRRMQIYGLVDEIVESSGAALELELGALLRAMARAEPKAVAEVKASGRVDRRELREAMLCGGRRTAAMLAGPAAHRRITALQEWGAPWTA
jgi:enoyl-CoA hydratase/carnithine racemase